MTDKSNNFQAVMSLAIGLLFFLLGSAALFSEHRGPLWAFFNYAFSAANFFVSGLQWRK